MKTADKLKIREKFTLPAGAYYIGDPCYILNDKTYDNILMPVMREANRNGRDTYEFYSNPHNEYTQRGVVMGTLHGDGIYYDNIGVSYPVDSGQIACIDIASIGLKADIIYYVNTKAVYLYNFDKPFDCVRHDNGVLRFNSISINTGDIEESQ